MIEEKLVEDLVLKCKKGDKKALTELMELFKPYICKVALNYYIKDYEVIDMIQEGNKALLYAAGKYSPGKSKFIYYAFLSIKNNYKMLLRSAKNKYEDSLNYKICEDIELMDLIPDEINIEDEFILNEEYVFINKVLDKLNAEEKEFIDMVYYKNMTVKEYAKIKNMKYHEARYFKKRVLEKVRGYFNMEF